jgi:quercetin dioxygenase-like cupin family protein
MTHRHTRVRWDEIPLDKVTDMVSRKAVNGASLELVQMYFKKGTLVPLGLHATERLVYVLQGVMRFIVDGNELILREGEVLVLPANALRQAESLDDTFLMLVGIRS